MCLYILHVPWISVKGKKNLDPCFCFPNITKFCHDYGMMRQRKWFQIYLPLEVEKSQKVFSIWTHPQNYQTKVHKTFDWVIWFGFLTMGPTWKYLLRLSHLYIFSNLHTCIICRGRLISKGNFKLVPSSKYQTKSPNQRFYIL